MVHRDHVLYGNTIGKKHLDTVGTLELAIDHNLIAVYTSDGQTGRGHFDGFAVDTAVDEDQVARVRCIPPIGSSGSPRERFGLCRSTLPVHPCWPAGHCPDRKRQSPAFDQVLSPPTIRVPAIPDPSALPWNVQKNV